MGKNSVQAGQVASKEKKEPVLSLTDFCARLSETVKRPELIGAFEFRERTAGRVKATDAEFRKRFDEFVKTPV